MYTPIGSFDAKAKLSQLLAAVQKGERFTITLRGRPIADLVPSETARPHAAEAVAALRRMEKIRGLAPETVAALIAEGRR